MFNQKACFSFFTFIIFEFINKIEEIPDYEHTRISSKRNT